MSTDFVLLGCLEETRDSLHQLDRLGVRPDHLVGLRRAEAERQRITNHVDLRVLAESQGVPYSEVGDYSMRSEADLQIFADLSPAILAVVGWQRLVPEPVLRAVRVAALGFHGSANVLPWGRGRSPINWSIIEGRDRFALHMFVLTPGVDDGRILGMRLYDINSWDTCRSVYYKTALAQAELLARHLPQLRVGQLAGLPQAGEPFYYPKRTPSDGEIAWSCDAEAICRLVRAVTWPYPGAFTHMDGEQIMIWGAQPFSRDFFADARPGEVCFVARNGTGEFVVRCGDGAVLVTRATGADLLSEGMVLR